MRSSAVGEDGAAASFAGIHESFLDATDVPRAVRGCWGSLWTPRAVAYRRRFGLSDEAVACAVVLCRMVAARSAGVAFTCDPATGRRDLVVVEAVPGLGDRLVRGEATPERVVLRRVRGLFRVESRTGEGVLPDDGALLLARLAWRVMWALGEDPQDLEWAWDGGRLHLLQARPGTRLPHHTFAGVRGQPVWWSNANMKDAVPGVVSPLAWSVIQEAIPDVLYALPHAVGYEVPPGMPITRPIGMTPQETVRAIGGHRAVYEADSMNPRWGEDPSYLLDQVRAFLPSEEGESPRRRAAALRRQALADLRRRCSWWRWPLVRWALHRVSTGLALREAAKSALCATVAPGRRLALELGRRLVAAGHLADREDVFFLTRPDLEALLDGEWDGRGAASLAADRRSQREEWLQHEPPDVLREDGTAWATPSQAPASAGALTGLGVSSGAATGAARLLRHPHEGHRLGNGEVLVAPSTDPGWTPLFLRASAIVMESGGYLSHGAIVAREFGIPAVTNVPGLLSRVRDGEVLRVDGDRGVVERVEG